MDNTGEKPDLSQKKAKAFFERAEMVAETDNFDYAIDLYIEGLRRAPETLGDGHIPLRRNALIRQGKGGKKPSVVDKIKHSRAKTSLEEMLNAEYLLAKDPDNISYAEAMLKAAVAGGYCKTGEWIGGLVFEANMAREKPSFQTFLLLKDSYCKIGVYDKAVAACRWAVKLKPEDNILATELRDLSAQMTVKKGKYEEEGDFRQSIKDMDKQEQLWEKDSLVKSEEYYVLEVAEARKSLVEDPNSVTNIIRLANALVALEDEKSYREATDLLQDSFDSTGDATFKRRMGEIGIRLARNRVGQARAKAEAEPGNTEAKEVLALATDEFTRAELSYYTWAVQQYSMDLKLKYEYGLRLLWQRKYDEAIPMFQEARKSPRHKVLAMDKTGLCFFMKGWYSDAVDVFLQAIEEYEIEDDAIGKNLRYNLARTYEAGGNVEEALELYRRLAQVDYTFKDVRLRVERLRNPDDESTS